MGSNQHYVPQLYLRRFSTPGTKNKKIFRYSIEFDKIEKDTSISNTSSEESFYDSELDPYFSQMYGKDNLELILSEFETEYSSLLKSIEETLISSKPINQIQHERISYFMYLQYVRTMSYREKVSFPISPLSKKAGHGLMMVSPNAYESGVGIFASRRYIIGRVFPGKMFVTSDNPVGFISSMHFDQNDVEESLKRFSDMIGPKVSKETRGFDLVMPLSKHHVLIGIEEETSSVKILPSQHFINLDLNTTINIISGIALDASRHIYSSTRNELEYAILLLKAKRIEIENRPEHIKRRMEEFRWARAKNYPSGTNYYKEWLERKQRPTT